MVLDVDGGLLADPRGREGLAAMTADMVDEGVGELSTIDLSDAMARIGADYSADVGPDSTRFALTTLSKFADRGASLLADILTRPSLRQSDFDRVRQLRLDRILQLKDSPGGRGRTGVPAVDVRRPSVRSSLDRYRSGPWCADARRGRRVPRRDVSAFPIDAHPGRSSVARRAPADWPARLSQGGLDHPRRLPPVWLATRPAACAAGDRRLDRARRSRS